MNAKICLFLIVSCLTAIAPGLLADAKLPPPTMIDPLVATDAGFVAFSTDGIQFSPDGQRFARTQWPDVQTPFAARPVTGGAVAASQFGLLHTDARGELSQPYFQVQQISGLAGDGRGAVAIEWSARVHVWVGGREWATHLVAEGAELADITHAFGRYWIAGSMPLGEDETEPWIWSSPDGRTWSPIGLSSLPSPTDQGSLTSRFRYALAVPGCLLIVDHFGRGVVTRDGKTWKWTTVPQGPAADSQRYYADGSRLVRDTEKEGELVESIVSIDGVKWVPQTKTSAWHLARAIPGGKTPHYHVMTGPSVPAVIIPESVYREPARFAAEQEKARLAAEAAAAAEALARKQMAEQKARAEQQTRERKRQAIAANLADVSGVFQGTANGIHWDGEQLLVSADGGIYRSGDGTRFALWIPREGAGFQGLSEAGGRLWTWSGSPDQGRSELMGFPPNSGGKLPGYQTAAGRITGIAGEGQKLAFITEAGNWCYVYASDDGGDRWSFSPVKAGDLLPMQYGHQPGRIGPGLAYGNGRWVAVGRRADNTTAAAVSTDRVNWKVVPVGTLQGGLMRIVFAHGRFVASGQKSFTADAPWVIASSPDGEAWEVATLPGESPGLVDVAGGRLYAHNRTGLFTSDDARLWRRVATHAPLDAVTLQEIGGRLVLVGEPVSEGRAKEPLYQLVQVAKPSAVALAALPDVATQPVLAAVEKFDAAVLASRSPAGMGSPLGALLTALDRLIPGPIADAVADVAADYMISYGGVRGTFDLLMSVPGPRMALVQGRLTPDQRAMIKVFATAHNAQLSKQPVDTRAVAAAEATWPAGEYVEGFRGPLVSAELDLARVRQAAFSGKVGAMHDLNLIYEKGAGAPRHGTLGHFWGRVHRRLDPAMPADSAGEEALLDHLAKTGSPYFAGRAAILELEANGVRLTDSLLERLEVSARDGMMLAQEILDELQDDIRQRRESGRTFDQIYATKPPAGAASAGDWFKAAARLHAASAGDDSGVSDEEMGLGPDALARTRAELKAMGMSDADIAAFHAASSERQAALQADLKARGISAEAAGAAMNSAMTDVLRDQVRDLAQMPKEDLQAAARQMPAGAVNASPNRKPTADREVDKVGRVRAETVQPVANGIEVLRLDTPDLALSFSSKVGFAEGLYSLTSGYTVYFSPDAREWQKSTINLPGFLTDMNPRVDRVMHDGKRWVAVVFNAKPEVFLSTDRENWTPGGDWKLSGRHLAARDGQFWTAHAFLGLGSYYRGRFDGKAGDFIREWDGQVQDRLESEPRAVMQDGRRLYLVTDAGRLLSTDNGNYWEELGELGVAKADRAFYAEGATAAVAVVVKGTLGSARAEVRVQRDDRFWHPVKVPFDRVNALAYGLDRFVVIGVKGGFPGEHALYESTDGENWNQVTVLRGAPESLAYGPAGFVTNWTEIGPGKHLLVYRPPGAVEKPARVRPPTPVPPARFRDFGTNYSGRGKYRTNEGPKTPDQRRVAELAALVPKAEAGDAAAKRELAFALLEGRHAYANPWRAELWFKEAQAAGDASAGRGYAQLLMAWKPETPMAEIEALFHDSAARGDVPAKAWLASRQTYLAHLARAEAGDVEAIMRVAPLLLKGEGVAPDAQKALRMVWVAGDKKHIPALMMLAEQHEKEHAEGVPATERSFNSANYTGFLTAAGDLGHGPALRKLVTAYATGAFDVPKDEKLAYAAALKLANLGDPEGMVVVGGALLEGRIVAQDAAAGGGWIRQAAAKGHAQAKVWVEQQAAVAQRSAARPPLDGRVAGVTAGVLETLQQIQATTAPALGDADLRALFGAVWFDAEYALAEEDLAQELAAAGRPVTVTAADGRTLAFTKTLPATGTAGFARALPVGFNADELSYYFALWQQTANAGLLVAATRRGEPQKVMVRQALAKGLFDMAVAPKPRNTQALAEYFKQLKASHAAAAPAVQTEFRELLAQAVALANQAAKQTGHDSLLPYVNFAWQ